MDNYIRNSSISIDGEHKLLSCPTLLLPDRPSRELDLGGGTGELVRNAINARPG